MQIIRVTVHVFKEQCSTAENVYCAIWVNSMFLGLVSLAHNVKPATMRAARVANQACNFIKINAFALNQP